MAFFFSIPVIIGERSMGKNMLVKFVLIYV